MIHRHEWQRLDEKPTMDYWDFSGYHVFVFKCRCKKCGKVRKKKFY